MTGEGRPRLHLLDEIRGFAVLCIVFFHGFYTFYSIFEYDTALRLFNFFMPAEPYFAAAFILICGISTALSRSNLRRGLILLAVALLVTAATVLLRVFGINEIIRFGILHLLSVSILLFVLLRKLLDKVPSAVLFVITAVLFAVTARLEDGLLGFPGLYLTLPESARDIPFVYIIGIPSSSFFSSDYFPIFPWFFCFLAGTVLGRYLFREKVAKVLSKRLVPPLSFLGRHALVIYLLHQPVIFAVGYLIKWIFG